MIHHLCVHACVHAATHRTPTPITAHLRVHPGSFCQPNSATATAVLPLRDSVRVPWRHSATQANCIHAAAQLRIVRRRIEGAIAGCMRCTMPRRCLHLHELNILAVA